MTARRAFFSRSFPGRLTLSVNEPPSEFEDIGGTTLQLFRWDNGGFETAGRLEPLLLLVLLRCYFVNRLLHDDRFFLGSVLSPTRGLRVAALSSSPRVADGGIKLHWCV